MVEAIQFYLFLFKKRSNMSVFLFRFGNCSVLCQIMLEFSWFLWRKLYEKMEKNEKGVYS